MVGSFENMTDLCKQKDALGQDMLLLGPPGNSYGKPS